jgi:hypothetical protein
MPRQNLHQMKTGQSVYVRMPGIAQKRLPENEPQPARNFLQNRVRNNEDFCVLTLAIPLATAALTRFEASSKL